MWDFGPGAENILNYRICVPQFEIPQGQALEGGQLLIWEFGLFQWNTLCGEIIPVSYSICCTYL